MKATTSDRRASTASGGRPGGRPGRSIPILPIVLAFVVVLGVVAVLATRGADPAADVPQWAPVDVAGETLPPFSTVEGDPATGRPAPALAGVDFTGAASVFTPGERPTMLVFMAHWCPHCQREVADLSPWLAESPPEGIDVIAVSTAVDESAPNYPPSTWLQREGWPAGVLLDDSERSAASAYGLSSYPFFVLVDADGNVAGRAAGALGVDQVEQVLERLRG